MLRVTDSTKANRADQKWHERLKTHAVPAAVVGIVAVIGGITAAISYDHEQLLARRNGQAAWVAYLVPFAVDGMVAAASIVLLWAAWQGIKGWGRLWRPRLWLAVGIGATIAANLFSDLRFWWLGPAVSASCGIALVIISDIAFWLLGEQRKASGADQPSTDAGHVCPPPPATVADALPLARAWLMEHGEQYGEQALAERFGVTRHEVRKVLSPPSLNGSGPDA